MVLYVDPQFIKKYGRAGRSWGCPALPPSLSSTIINTIKNNSLFVVYYPSDDWFAKSKFQNCRNASEPIAQEKVPLVVDNTIPIVEENDKRDDILFVDLNRNNRHDEYEPVVTMSADNYKRIFQTKPPLGRMLRRQINHEEYIVLTNSEIKTLALSAPNPSKDQGSDVLNTIQFVIPAIKMVRGYYETEMKIVPFSQLKEVKPNDALSEAVVPKSFTLYFDTRPSVTVKSTSEFVRWVGL